MFPFTKKINGVRTAHTDPSDQTHPDANNPHFPKTPQTLRHPLLSSFSSKVILTVTISIIACTTVLISFFFVTIVREFLIENRTRTIFSLVEQQTTRHLDSASTFSTWDQEYSKQKFQDVTNELLGSYRNIAALEFHTSQGVLAWASLNNVTLGTTLEKDTVAEVLNNGRVHGDASASTIAELGIQDLVEVYVPIREPGGPIVGVAEVYLNLSDIFILTQRVQMVLWVFILLSTIIIFFLLRFAFRHRDAQIINRTKELENLAKSLEEKVAERTKHIEDDKIKDEALLASLGEGMIATDNEGRVTNMNRAAEKMLEWHIDEVIGRKLVEVIPTLDDNGDIVPPEKRMSLMAAVEGVSTVTENHVRFVKKNGGRVPVLVTANPIVINKKNTGAVVIFRDITKEKELEETRSNLLSLASHQLRTPLSGTMWLIETLKKGLKGPLNEGQVEYLDEIYNINIHMSSLVQDMMKVLRVEGNVDQTHKERVSVASIFYTLLETLNAAIKSKEITLHLPDDLGDEIITDQLMLRSILECLVSNAINYSKHKGEVSVGIEKRANELVFSIKDSGIGIPQEEQGHIFERFYRTSNAKTFDAHGTGLGLYVASMLAKKISVLLSFESEEGRGTTFYVHVPYADTK